ncbi:uncharacterized protein LOC129788772 [Lutzomyia longipalpis]|uniref:uncharacterized protein LOC129788772 n=1 Tax=Lutzomyia longipalpis TaxID=7200 RepID=UPI0024836874|nr:uncharacterized protein LOC129788772 [Lutzomyia longipalpis]
MDPLSGLGKAASREHQVADMDSLPGMGKVLKPDADGCQWDVACEDTRRRDRNQRKPVSKYPHGIGEPSSWPQNPHRMSLSDPRVSGRKRLLSGLSRKGLHPKCEEEKYHRSPTGREKMLPSTRPHVDGCDPTGSVSKGKPFHCRANGRRRAEVSTQRWKKLLHCNIRRGRRILRAVRRETDGCEDALHRDELQENTEWRTWIPFRGWGKSSSLVPKDEHQENTKWKTWIPSRDWGKQHPENTKWLTWIPSREWGKSSSQMPMDVNGTWRARTLAEETGISENLYQVTMFHV